MSTITWLIGKRAYKCQVLPQTCPICKAKGTLVGLPPPILKQQPDDTNVVCHPNLKGCNHGFSLDVPNETLSR